MSDILLGTCGWSYAEWEGILYPYAQNKLKQYSSIFPTAEIDSTFYALPQQGTVFGWARNTSRDFVFSAKLPQTITHKKVIDPELALMVVNQSDWSQRNQPRMGPRDDGVFSILLESE